MISEEKINVWGARVHNLKNIDVEAPTEPIQTEQVPAYTAYREEPEAEDDDIEDDAEESGLNPKLDKAMTIMGIVALAVIVIVIIYLIVGAMKLINPGKSNESQTTQTETQTESQTDSPCQHLQRSKEQQAQSRIRACCTQTSSTRIQGRTPDRRS